MGDIKKIVVLGGGYGGILAAKKMAKKLKKDNVEITLIDKKPYHTLLTELHEVAANRAPEDSIRIDLKKIFAGRNVNVVLDEIENLDFDNKVLKSKANSYEYDYLVVGTGSRPTFFGMDKIEEHAFQLWSYEDAVNLKEHILNMFREASKESNPETRKELLTFIVVGGGFTGVEMIGELGEWKDRLCKDFYIDVNEVRLIVADALPSVLPNFPANLIAKAEKRLKKLGVETLYCAKTTEVTANSVIMEDKDPIMSRTVIWAAGVEGSDTLNDAKIEQKGRKRIVTNDKLQSVDYEDVYAVGDNIFFIPEGEERPVPQMVENAEHSSACAANNIVAAIKGTEQKPYKPAFHGAMVCIGGRYGLAHLGMPGKFFGLSGWLAMFVKHFINLIYFVQVAGFNKCWTYIIHEFFHIKDNRSIVGGYFSKSSPNFWLLPLRMFIGWKWLSEGLEKLPKIQADPSNIFLIPAKVMDGVGGASEVVEEVAPVVSDAVASASQVVEAVVGSTGGAVEAVSAYGPALPVPEFIGNIMSWSLDTFFYTVDGGFTTLASVFQTSMVFGEIIFGLALIVGLFSSLSAIATIVMGLMIWMSGMAPLEMLWYLVGGVALIGGSGSTFGLDYYVLPWLKKRWNNIKIVQKWYLYIS